MTTVRGVLRLVRASIALSPLADGVASLALARAAGPLQGDATLLTAAALWTSLCAYAFGMSLNDLADRAHDARTRPDRPLPSGAVSVRAARVVVGAALVLGLLPVLVLPAPAAVLAVTLFATIAIYDLWPAHAERHGPVLLGAARAQNLLLCATALGHGAAALPAALLYGAYVGAVSVAARFEDALERSRVPLVATAFRVAAIVAIAASLHAALFQRAPLAAALPALGIGVLLAARVLGALKPFLREPSPGLLARAVGQALSGIFLFDAALAAAVERYVEALVLLLAFPVSRALARRFPPS